MPSTYPSDNAKARGVVGRSRWPTIMPDKIGTIGSTQGVKVSPRPNTKKVATMSSQCASCRKPARPSALAVVDEAGTFNEAAVAAGFALDEAVAAEGSDVAPRLAETAPPPVPDMDSGSSRLSVWVRGG